MLKKIDILNIKKSDKISRFFIINADLQNMTSDNKLYDKLTLHSTQLLEEIININIEIYKELTR